MTRNSEQRKRFPAAPGPRAARYPVGLESGPGLALRGLSALSSTGRPPRACGATAIGLAVLATILCTAAEPPPGPAAPRFPEWTRGTRLADLVLELATSDEDVDDFAAEAARDGATVVLVHFEAENFYGSLVDEAGYLRMRGRMERTLRAAHGAGLKVCWYVNGLEVMTPGAAERPEAPSLARRFPDWLQRRQGTGEPIVFRGLHYDWVTPDMEDAWICPLSGYRDLLKQRITDLGRLGLDAVWIDACFLPGVQPDRAAPIWGCACPRCAQRLAQDLGVRAPFPREPADATFQAWLRWRHELLAGYLADLAAHAWSKNVVPFFETSTLDTPDCTLLGNDPAFLRRVPIGYAPEIDVPDAGTGHGESMAGATEEQWFDYLTMLLHARDLAGERPCWVLQYAGGARDGARQLGATFAAVGSYFPVLGDAGKGSPEFARRAYRFVREAAPLRAGARPYAAVLLLVSSQARDRLDAGRGGQYATEGTDHFRSYRAWARQLLRAHVPFRIVTDLKGEDLSAVAAVVVPEGVEAAEVGAVPAGTAVVRGAPETAGLPKVELPFTVEAPAATAVLYARTTRGWLVSFHPLGRRAEAAVLTFRTPRRFRVRTLGGERSAEGTRVDLPAEEPFHLVEFAE